MKTLRIVSGHSEFNDITTGVMTYWKDFNKLVIPELNNNYKIVDNASEIFLSFHKPITFNDKLGSVTQRERCKVIRILHTSNFLNAIKNHADGYTKYITHYKKIVAVASMYNCN